MNGCLGEAESKPSLNQQPKSNTTGKKPARTCAVCGAKKVKFQVCSAGKIVFLCSDECCQKIRKEKAAAAAAEKSEQCSICSKRIAQSGGYFSFYNGSKPLCSKECLQKYDEQNAPKRECAQCQKRIEDDSKSILRWETMEFCGEDCLEKYQNVIGSSCACCGGSVQRPSLGKFCVRFGSDLKQFCSGKCLDEFKKGIKNCTFCQKDLSSMIEEGFLAPVGDKDVFKEFCSQRCFQRFEKSNSKAENSKSVEECSVCGEIKNCKYVVSVKEKEHSVCSDVCDASFRYKNKIKGIICESCNSYFDKENAQSCLFFFKGKMMQFCTKDCLNIFMLSDRKIVSCFNCKAKKYNFDMIIQPSSTQSEQLFCSLHCLSLFRVKSSTTSQPVCCETCNRKSPPQYFLEMSDGSLKNFCSEKCVRSFQITFKNTPVPSTSLLQSGIPTTGHSPAVSSSFRVGRSRKDIVVPKGTTLSPAVRPVAPVNQSSPTTVYKGPPAAVKVQQIAPQKTVIVQPPAPKMLKNKSMLCKPLMKTEGVSCRPYVSEKACQTVEETKEEKDNKMIDEIDETACLLPVPVPIYVPVPFPVCSEKVPVPFPFCVPLPIPIMLPTSKKTCEELQKAIKEMSEMKNESEFLKAASDLFSENVLASEVNKSQSEDSKPVLEDDALASEINKSLSEDSKPILDGDALVKPSSKGIKRASSDDENSQEEPNKKACVEVESKEMPDKPAASPLKIVTENSPSTKPTPQWDSEENDVFLKEFGLRAWREWVEVKNGQLEKVSQSSRKFKFVNPDLLKATPEELNYSLCLFIKEVRKVSGEEYGPSSIYHLCLGIQQYLFENERLDNLFFDPQYETFTVCLNNILEKVHILEGTNIPRLKEEILWNSRQLGAHTPYVLLNTLMYFNTKYFLLRTVDDHASLSVSHVKKEQVSNGEQSHWVLKYNHNSNGTLHREHLKENFDDRLRCPVKLFEFYMSKCPGTVVDEKDVYYVCPRKSCLPDDQLWFSSQPLGKDVISKMLNRIQMVQEIHEAHRKA